MTNQNNAMVNAMLQAAVNGVQNRRSEKGLPPFTEDERTQFVARIQENIDHSDAKRSVRDHEADLIYEDRQDRLDAVKASANKYNIKFSYNRNMEVEVIELDRIKAGHNTEIVTTEEKLVKSTFGGSTIAWINTLDPKTNKVYRVYATAFCGEFEKKEESGNTVYDTFTGKPIIVREKFDKLIGMEESLKKFLAGMTLVAEVPESRLGYVRQELMARDFKLKYPK